ncbi:universal stress protein [Streptomyces sp. NPDC023723]|uniref:universal stress protein n=1 Tax=Streptomyces sp. NPDC023723 TaxID=3154323 RepID=UPI0033C9CE24
MIPRPVVVGLDGSRESLAAAHWAAREALRRELPLRLVHAFEGLPDSGTRANLPELRAPQYFARRILRAAVDELNERYPRLFLAAEQVAKQPGPALLAEDDHAEMLVVGSQGFGAVGGLVAGSVAMVVAAHAGRPVVLVRAGTTEEAEHLPVEGGKPSVDTPCRDVAVALDTGGPCEEVLSFAFRAAELRHAPLRVAHAWHVPLARGVVDAEERARIRRAVEREVEELLTPWRQKFPGVPVTAVLHEGRAGHVLVRAAEGAGLLVAGRRGRRAAPGPHTGPVAHALIHHVGCPVALIPHD